MITRAEKHELLKAMVADLSGLAGEDAVEILIHQNACRQADEEVPEHGRLIVARQRHTDGLTAFHLALNELVF